MMDDERALADRLAEVNVPPTTVRVEDLVRDGRRRAFRRRATTASGGVALVAVAVFAIPSILNGVTTDRAQPAASASASASPTAQPSPSARACAIAELAVPAGVDGVSASGVDPTGRYIIGTGSKGQDFIPMLWTDGKPQVLPVRGTSGQPTAVNAAGVVVGIGFDGNKQFLFRYADGVVTKLRMPSGGPWLAYPEPDINAAGDIVVNIKPPENGGVSSAGSRTVIWRAGAVTPVRLPLGENDHVFAITDGGALVGTRYRDGVGAAGYAWDQQGHGVKLSVPAGQTGAAYAGRGDWAAGGIWPDMSGMLWNIRTGVRTPVPTDGPLNSVNSSGWTVMTGGRLFRDGAIIALPGGPGERIYPRAVSDSGLVVGAVATGSEASERVGPRTWQC